MVRNVSFEPLGNDRELVVSANHRMLVETYKAEMYFGELLVLLKAKDLVNDDDIYRREDRWICCQP